MVDATSDFFKKGLFNILFAKTEFFNIRILETVFNKPFFIYFSFHSTTGCSTSFCSLGNRLSDDNSFLGKHPTGYVHMVVKGQVPSNYTIFAPFQVN